MSQYDNHLVSGAALEEVLKDIHGDQQRQDATTAGIQDNMPTAIDVVELSTIWNNI